MDKPATVPTRSPLRRMITSLITIIVLVYVGWIGVLYVKQDELIFPRHLAGQGGGGVGGVGGAAATIPSEVTRVWQPLGAANGEIVHEKPVGESVEAWMYRPPNVRPGPQGLPAVIFAHGNGELIDSMVSYAQEWMSRGYVVLMPEYRGYGRSAGEPSERDIVADYAKWADWLGAQQGIDKTRLVYHGRSLGTGVVAQLAASAEHRRPVAMVLESPFTSIAGMAMRFGAPGFVVRHPFRTDAVLPGLAQRGTRVLILHSPHDEIIPYSHGTKLAAMTPGAKLVDLSGSHLADLCGLPAYWEGVDTMLGHDTAEIADERP